LAFEGSQSPRTEAMMPTPEEFDLEPQDRAETLDEAEQDEMGQEFRTFEELPDVLDVTRADGDADDDDEALDAADYDPDDLDTDDIDEDEEDVEGKYLVGDEELDEDMAFADEFDEDDPGATSIEGLDEIADADTVEGGEDDFTNFQSKAVNDDDLERMGYAEHQASADDVLDRRDPHTEANLDEGIEETFPASDPVSISPGSD
jgi:hypothetical protein